MGRRTISRLNQIGVAPIAIVDNYRHGEVVGGREIWSLEHAIRLGQHLPYFVTIWQGGDPRFRLSDAESQLRDAGVHSVLSILDLYWTFPDVLCPYLICDVPEKTILDRHDIERAFGLFTEDVSRELFLNHVRFRLDGNFEWLRRSDGVEYFDFQSTVTGGLRMIDCGAYTGDTIHSALERGLAIESVMAIEPDPNNFAVIASQVAEGTLPRTVRPIHRAIGAHPGLVAFSANSDMTSHVSEDLSSQYRVEVTTIDELCRDMSFQPNFIKVDVEGSEIPLLQGARKTLDRSRPQLAIALEHNYHDLWSIPLMVKSISKDYTLFLRHYSEQGFDVVLYAIPNENL